MYSYGPDINYHLHIIFQFSGAPEKDSFQKHQALSYHIIQTFSDLVKFGVLIS